MNSHYGIYGGQYVAETLMPTLHALEEEYLRARQDPAFQRELSELLTDYVGRESPLYFAKRLTEYAGGARIYLKREDLNHTGAHKINNTIGQALLARRMGKKRLIAETGAGMHGVATATVAALFGMECDVFMGAVDVARQAPNVERMKTLGARVIAVESGSATLKDAMNEAIRDWVATEENTFYVIGTVAGPHPYPAIVRDFQSVIGVESRRQILEKAEATRWGCSPDSSPMKGCGSPASKRAETESKPAATPPASAADRSACSTAARPICCRPMTGRSSKPIRSPPDWITPASAPNTASSPIPAESVTWRSTIPRRWLPSTPFRAWRESFPRSNRATRWRRRSASPRNSGRRGSCSSASPGAATRIWTTSDSTRKKWGFSEI